MNLQFAKYLLPKVHDILEAYNNMKVKITFHEIIVQRNPNYLFQHVSELFHFTIRIKLQFLEASSLLVVAMNCHKRLTCTKINYDMKRN